MGWLSSLRGGNWLLGVYKGELITASDGERDAIWKYSYGIRSKGVFRTADKRQKLVPYFFVLAPITDIDILSCWKSGLKQCSSNEAHSYLGGFGLDFLAYKYGSIEAIPAYGDAKNGCFILDNNAVEQYQKRTGYPLAERMNGRVCALALKMESGIVRTGTFFEPSLKDGRILLTPLKISRGLLGGDIRNIVGKGILLGMAKDEQKAGGMYQEEYESEMKCPVAKLCVSFYTHHNRFYTVYREVSTDLRADMPLAMLKILQIDGNAFENMFKKLGASVKEEFGRRTVEAWNVLLDGNPVDFGDIPVMAVTKRITNIKKELCKMILSAALISAAGKNALLAMAGSDAEAKRLAQENKERVQEKYGLFFGKFAEGAGKVTEVFEEVGKIENVYLEYFFERGHFPPFDDEKLGWLRDL